MACYIRKRESTWQNRCVDGSLFKTSAKAAECERDCAISSKSSIPAGECARESTAQDLCHGKVYILSVTEPNKERGTNKAKNPTHADTKKFVFSKLLALF
jgi:hypothetical protein